MKLLKTLIITAAMIPSIANAEVLKCSLEDGTFRFIQVDKQSGEAQETYDVNEEFQKGIKYWDYKGSKYEYSLSPIGLVGFISVDHNEYGLENGTYINLTKDYSDGFILTFIQPNNSFRELYVKEISATAAHPSYAKTIDTKGHCERIR